jgi:hypothetical protein
VAEFEFPQASVAVHVRRRVYKYLVPVVQPLVEFVRTSVNTTVTFSQLSVTQTGDGGGMLAQSVSLLAGILEKVGV